MMLDQNKLVTIGEIINTHGHFGEVRVWPQTDFSERFENMKKVFVSKGGHPDVYNIDRVRYHKQFVIIKFAEVPDMNGAEALKGALLQIEQKDLMPLPENTFYIFELVGMAVYTVAGDNLGVIRDIIQTGSNDVYVIKSPAGKDILIPALKHVVKEINVEEKKMVVEPLPGLLEI